MTPASDTGVGRHFYTWAAVGCALLVFAGFARTYYLKGAYGAKALTDLVHLHGAVMTCWFALFLIQSRLIAARRVRLHRRLGVVGAILAGLVLVVGVTTSIAAARHGTSSGAPALVFLAVPLGDMLVFAVLVTAGLLLRRRPDMHRRLMLLCCVGILTPAIARLPLGFIKSGGPLVYFGLVDLCIVACAAYDTVRHRRLHPAFLWGTLLIAASQPLRLFLSTTSAWLRFATWLTG